MSITDPIANAATLIRNASRANKKSVDIKSSKVNEKILEILKEEKFIQNFKGIPDNNQGTIRVYLKQEPDKRPSITKIVRISRPGLRVYKKNEEIAPVLGGLGIAIISTSLGIFTDSQAREKKLGGEIMLEVW